jgi:hypothetical protein
MEQLGKQGARHLLSRASLMNNTRIIRPWSVSAAQEREEVTVKRRKKREEKEKEF